MRTQSACSAQANQADKAAVEADGVTIGNPEVVSGVFSMPGGGQEVIIRATEIPTQYLTRIR